MPRCWQRQMGGLLLGLVVAGMTLQASAQTPAAVAPTLAVAFPLTPVAVIAAFNASLLEVMRLPASRTHAATAELVQAALARTFDTITLARLALGRAASEFSPMQLYRYNDLFRAHAIATYIARFNGFDGESFVVDDARTLRRGRMLVHTRLLQTDSKHVRLDYLMHRTAHGWRVINVVANGVSELSIRRAEFRALLTNSDAANLISKLEAQIARLMPPN